MSRKYRKSKGHANWSIVGMIEVAGQESCAIFHALAVPDFT